MLVKTSGIILHRFKYGDSSLICKIFTREFGLQSFLFQGISSNRGKIRNAHLIPLNLVEIDFYNNPVKNLKRAKELSCKPILHSLHINPVKRALGGFIQEILNRCISEEEINIRLYEHVFNTILTIEESERTQEWLPHLFITRLCHIVGNGIFTDEYSEGMVFNLANGCFTNIFDVKHCLSPELSEQLVYLINDEIAENNYRKKLLDSLILFLHYHIIGSKPLHSLDIFSLVSK